jgi:hypothetical protein
VQEVVKCTSCDRKYKAPLRKKSPQKFDETADASLVINRYLAATSAYRLSGLQGMCGITLPISTIHGRCEMVVCENVNWRRTSATVAQGKARFSERGDGKHHDARIFV